MIKICVDNSLVGKYYQGVKDYIGIHLFTVKEKAYFTNKKIEEFIKCKPSDFDALITEIESKSLDKDIIKNAFVGAKSFNFGYKKFSAKDTTKAKKYYRAYNLANDLSIDVCPYCNKNYTYTIINRLRQYTRPDFDHFLAKEIYPYFALSFYNLIPSCQVCNRTLKHSTEFTLSTHLHPYKDDFNSIKKFSTNKPLVSCTKEDEFNITFEDKIIDSVLLGKADKNIEDLALDLQYNRHKDIVLELKDRYNLYNDASIQNILKDTKVFKEKDKKYIKSLIMCLNVEDKNINKRPLSKLTKDISEELGLV